MGPTLGLSLDSHSSFAPRSISVHHPTSLSLSLSLSYTFIFYSSYATVDRLVSRYEVFPFLFLYLSIFRYMTLADRQKKRTGGEMKKEPE